MNSMLLEKMRKINKLLQKTSPQLVVFSDICEVMSEGIKSNVYIINKKGKILGASQLDKENIDIFTNLRTNDFVDQEMNSMLLKVRDTQANMSSRSEIIEIYNSLSIQDDVVVTIIPINGGGERLGTLLVYRKQEEFNDEDLVIIEYGSTVVGIEILIAKQEELRVRQAENEQEIRKKAIVQLAIGTLSYSELEAIVQIFNELEGNEGLLIASKIADRAKITRSVIVNALRKFESAGLIEARSLGMKGTHIKVINDKLIDELKKLSPKN